MKFVFGNIEGKMRTCERGFTLIELLVVISIIGLLSTVAMTSLNGARAKARDTRRLSDMEQIRNALEMYRLDHGEYPEETSSDGGWETSNEDGGEFIEALKAEGYFPSGTPLDPVNSDGKYYYYAVYTAGGSDCPVSRGKFYVLAVKDMESSGRPYPGSPGWSCNPATHDWQVDYDWVAGGFAKD